MNGAELFLALDDCRRYGLIEGGPGTNRERCLDILERGRARGVTPGPFDELARLYMPALQETP